MVDAMDIFSQLLSHSPIPEPDFVLMEYCCYFFLNILVFVMIANIFYVLVKSAACHLLQLQQEIEIHMLLAP